MSYHVHNHSLYVHNFGQYNKCACVASVYTCMRQAMIHEMMSSCNDDVIYDNLCEALLVFYEPTRKIYCHATLQIRNMC